jgi:hypothetical protein
MNMNRRELGIWGIDLPPDEFDGALAAALLLSAMRPRRWDYRTPQSYAERLLNLIRNPGTPSGAAPALLDPSIVPQWPEAKLLSEAWRIMDRELNDEEFHPIRIELRGWMSHDPTWVLERLLQHEGGGSVHAAFLELPTPGSSRAWHVPLRIGFLPDPESCLLRERIQAHQYYPWLSTLVELRPGFESCDLLLLPHSLKAGLARVLELPFRLQASCLVLLGQSGDSFEVERPLALALRSLVNSSAVGWAHILSALGSAQTEENTYADWFNSFMRELSHDRPLDQALLDATWTWWVQSRAPILIADSSFIGQARISSAAEESVTRSLGGEQARKPLRVPERLATLMDLEELGLTPDGDLPPEQFATFADRLREEWQAAAFAWDSEGGDARDFSELARALDEIEVVPVEEARRVQVRVLDVSEPARPQREKRALLSQRPYAFDVCIARPDPEWMHAPERFPDEEIDFSRGPVKLGMVFTEPNLSPKPQVGELVLPAAGASTVCRFVVHVPPAIDRFRARIAIVYRNRVLQTILVSGLVIAREEGLSGDEAIQVDVESVTIPGFANLERRRHFDAALVLNHTGDGVPSATAVVDGEARWISTQRFQTSIDYITDKLTEMALAIRDDDQLYAQLESPETVDLLLYLALHGSDLYQGLIGDWRLPRLEGARRIQVVTTDFDRFLPVEFFYDRDVPDDDAKPCPKAREALLQGRCEDECPQPASSVICPFGFWCLSRVIERHTFDPRRETGRLGDYRLIPEGPVEGRDRLRPLRSAVFGASEKVDRKVPGQRDAVMNTLAALVHAESGRADTWEEWEEKVSEIDPTLLMLIPHTLRDQHDKAAIEIGDGATLMASRIKDRHVRADDASPPPIVFLLGCETGADDLAFDNFVAPLRRAHAALVVTTLSTVLGRHAAPIAQAFLHKLSEMSAQDTQPFGEVALAVRQKLVAEDMPAALTLAVYGDADWLLEAQ